VGRTETVQDFEIETGKYLLRQKELTHPVAMKHLLASNYCA
jgi:hypothetical protein